MSDAILSSELDRPWPELPEEEVGEAVVNLADEYFQRHSWRRELSLRMLSMYEGRNVLEFSSAGYSADQMKWPFEGEFVYQTRNLARKNVATQVAKIAARDAPKPALVVSDGNWELKRKATLCTRLLEAEYDQRQGIYANVHALGHQAWVLAAITGTSALKIFPYKEEKRVVIELHDTLDMFLDDSDLTYGMPMTYGERTWFNPARAARLWPDFKEAIWNAREEKKDSLHPGPQRTLLVPVYEAWYMASADSDGRYVATLRDGTVLEDKVWKRDEPPFVFLKPVPAVYGFWGLPWLATVEGEIEAVNAILGSIDEAHARTPRRTILVQENQKDLIERLQDTKDVNIIPVANIEFVKEFTTPAFDRSDLELLHEHENGIASVLGVADGISSARREPGLPSGAAQREVVAKYDDRHAREHREYVQFIAVDVGRHLLEAQRQLYKSVRGLKRRWQGEYFAKDIEAADILDLDLEALHLQVKPISEKKGTPEERVQLADELLAKQAITLETYLAVLEHYDVPGETRVAKTQRRWVAWQMDQWLFAKDDERAEGDFYKGPLEWMRKMDALIQVMDGLMSAQLDGAPDDRIQYFLDFIAELSAMITAELPPMPAQGQELTNPQSPLPGAGPTPRGPTSGQAKPQAGGPSSGPGQGQSGAAGAPGGP